ncbi:thiol:disulfide interchange protein TlpA [Aquabacter spiritensis]|uniref:Thiol-disulfide isomerase/thioredoxin n=1 Tax=Aquabacter spiritensis TaxID=933073 RepID=A0A4R3M0D1_9HYPH|nr:TlpA disulfide reductase family protein [Aquabacter spiritensis]TCT06036.1 thiol-disulfide isomerase/thioredoxin [Aquabacter spiritensis]
MTEPDAPIPHPPPDAARTGRGRMLAVLGVAALAGAVAGALALYVMQGAPGNAPAPSAVTAAQAAPVKDPACAPAVAAADRLRGLAKGEIAALSLATEPRRLPPLSFTDAAGNPMSLTDFKGKLLLVNLWATWCVPCREEMPALDALEQALGGDRFQVVAINLDTRDPAKPKAFLDEIGVKSLAFYADPGTKSFQALRAAGRGFGLPTSLLVDGEGCEIGFLAGPAEWAGADAKALIQAALAGPN